ncbi:hypothetical protein [Yersinia phage vB_YenM_P778]
MYTNDPINNAFDRVRVYITDTDNNELLVEQSIIEFFLRESKGNEKQAAIKCLNYLIFTIAKMADEKVGGVYMRNADRIKNMKLVLDDLKSTIGHGIGGAYAGGISVCDIRNRRCAPDSIKKPTRTGDAFSYYGTGTEYTPEYMSDVIAVVKV